MAYGSTWQDRSHCHLIEWDLYIFSLMYVLSPAQFGPAGSSVRRPIRSDSQTIAKMAKKKKNPCPMGLEPGAKTLSYDRICANRSSISLYMLSVVIQSQCNSLGPKQKMRPRGLEPGIVQTRSCHLNHKKWGRGVVFLLYPLVAGVVHVHPLTRTGLLGSFVVFRRSPSVDAERLRSAADGRAL